MPPFPGHTVFLHNGILWLSGQAVSLGQVTQDGSLLSCLNLVSTPLWRAGWSEQCLPASRPHTACNLTPSFKWFNSFCATRWEAQTETFEGLGKEEKNPSSLMKFRILSVRWLLSLRWLGRHFKGLWDLAIEIRKQSCDLCAFRTSVASSCL